MKSVEHRIAAWDSEKWGNHRALVEVASSGPVAAVRIPWRRPDSNPEDKGIFVRSQKSGEVVDNIYIHNLEKESGEIAFEAVSGPGIYEVYYMKYEGTTRAPYPVIHYSPRTESADPEWLRDVGKQWPGLKMEETIAIEASDELHSFYPMEVTASEVEVEQLKEKWTDRGFLIFPEHRENSIKMTRDLPYSWIEKGPFSRFSATARRGEYYVFQLGIYSHRQDLEEITVEYSGLDSTESSSRIPAEKFTCFNLEGISCEGQSFRKNLALSSGKVQPLWIGFPVDPQFEAGLYNGMITVSARDVSEQVALELTVLDEVIEASGDDNPYGMSRLRWLNSTMGSEDILIKPYVPVERHGNRLAILGREISLSPMGLPDAISSYFNKEVTEVTDIPFSILSGPVDFEVYGESGDKLIWECGEIQFSDQEGNSRSFSTSCRSGSLMLEIDGILEPDGCMEYNLQLKASERTELSESLLRVPFSPEAVRYILGLGFQGGCAPEKWTWSWDTVNKNQDSVWMGTENGGLQISLKDENYRRPLNTNFYRLQPLVTPVSWDNGGKGSISFEKDLLCSTGPRTLEKGDVLHYDFRLLITPFRPMDTDKQWRTRFYHRYNEPEVIKNEGATVVNLHHATPVNPFINYPFLKNKELKAYTDEVHRLGMKLRLYYTVRELTNHAPEIFALKSLGNEIFTSGPGGGHSWLQEHFREDYIAAWHVFEYGCVAVANSGNSRWHNFYIEGLDWLARNLEIDGVYIDDLAFDRRTMKRVRRVLDRHREEAIIDLHSANQFNEKDGYANSINMYMEHLPYIDKVWFGEYFDYSQGPDYWMTEVSGIPFGTMGEMLQDGGHIWRGMLYGMTSRYPHEGGDPTRVWKVWEEFGMEGCEMIGYWSPRCPVSTSCEDILATVYRKEGRALISLASWSQDDREVLLDIDWSRIGIDREKALLRTPLMTGYQKERSFDPGMAVPIRGNEGALIILEEK